MTRHIALGMLTPSSNTVLEPMTARILAPHPHITAHFSRFPVTQIALTPTALRQFDPAPILDAARLLADAHVDVIAWNGTSAAWIGFDSDERLCAAITRETGIPATSSVLALNAALHALGARTLGLVTPYTSDVQSRIVATYRAAGIKVLAERHLNDPGNYSFARFQEPDILPLLHAVAAAAPDAVTALCTNLRATPLAPAFEAETGIPLLDSIAVTLWHMLHLAGIGPARIQGWGRIFATGLQPTPHIPPYNPRLPRPPGTLPHPPR